MLFRFTLVFSLLLSSISYTSALPSRFLHHRDIISLNVSITSPSKDPFYTVPQNISEYPKGTIIQERKVENTTIVFGPDAGDVYQLKFRTNSVGMKPDAGVTTIIAPRNPAKGPPNIVAIASAVDSAAVDCALSWVLYPNSTSKEGRNGGDTFVLTAKAALHLGYYVTLPDQEGSKAAWGAYSEGQVVLDSILAIMNHKQTIPDKTGVKVALAGYSGGGHGAAWAGQLASTYGKGIPIVALAAGGIPVDLGASLTFLNNKIGSGLVFSGIAGLMNVYPDYEKYMFDIFRPNGTEIIKSVRDGTHCLPQTAISYAFQDVFKTVTDVNFLQSTQGRIVLDQGFLGKHQQPITDFPFYMVHSQIDDIVIYKPALDYYQSQCSKGAKIIFTSPLKGKHLLTMEAIPSMVYFIKAAFEGKLKVSSCNQTAEYLIPYNGQTAIATVGSLVSDHLKAAGRLFTVTDWLGSRL